ncbi:RmlC-like cupin [Aulographum hederae CBS 113979]|uniref:RmlC-like cupin n=1 Tax=Aulographum hederae CBS 113979 TaxID=1176131 RepID=A0A6G1H7X8_9PEZI|nr:RmlC-like cupin [Aulographum hederae CBS 113979]
MSPILLPPNQPPARFYKGGPRISTFRSITPPSGPRQPEDWVASTTCCHGQTSLGLTTLPSGRLLSAEVESDPTHWLGPEHFAAYGADTKLLVKLLDAGERLPVHAHPSFSWAREHVAGAKCGKAECWYFLTPGTVHLGLKEGISDQDLLSLIKAQDSEKLLSLTHSLDVEANQTIYIPPGLLHAIGEGILLVEVQEPSDLSILCEWRDYQIDGAADGHLGLGFEKAVTGVERKGRSKEEIMALVSSPRDFGSVVAEESREYFELERVEVKEEVACRQGFTIMIVLEGLIEMATETRQTLQLKKGSTVVIPHADGEIKLRGDGEVVFARPPKPT